MHKRLLTIALVTLSSIALDPARAQGPEADDADPWRALQTTVRGIPSAGGHPGNVFQLGDSVTVELPAGLEPPPTAWRAVDDRGVEVAHGRIGDDPPGPQRIGDLGIGWYRIEWLDASGNRVGWTTAAVLPALAAPVPQDSPVCVDAAIAWFARDDRGQQERFSRLASLCGVNWTRDRMRWREMQPASDRFATDTTYDSAAEIQHCYGLKILQVFHDTPPWAVAEPGGTGRFPGDLRDAYRFAEEMSRRFQGEVQAWEPWNEANVANFGGHTIDALCSYQKATYLGFKAGDPHVTVCWNATTGVPTRRHTAGLVANETWPYFDTYNIHSYDWPSAYERLWGPAREAACGKPIWVTESDRGSPVDEDSPTRDLSPRHERLKAEFVAQSYASSLHAGAQRHFHFILGQYGEGNIQFGLLRHDLTPRPGYVALAAVGRFLAGARCLGRHVIPESPDLHVIAFDARPDGERRDVLVAWAEREGDWSERGGSTADWPLPESIEVEASFDYLGRRVADGPPMQLRSDPSFVILPSGESARLKLESPARSAQRTGTPSAVVFQCLMPQASTIRSEKIRWAWEYEYRIPWDQEVELSLFIYNFASRDTSGTVTLEQAPKGCRIKPDRWDVRLAPMQRERLSATARVSAEEAVGATKTDRADDPSGGSWVRLRGEFPNAGRPVLAFQLKGK